MSDLEENRVKADSDAHVLGRGYISPGDDSVKSFCILWTFHDMPVMKSMNPAFIFQKRSQIS